METNNYPQIEKLFKERGNAASWLKTMVATGETNDAIEYLLQKIADAGMSGIGEALANRSKSTEMLVVFLKEGGYSVAADQVRTAKSDFLQERLEIACIYLQRVLVFRKKANQKTLTKEDLAQKEAIEKMNKKLPNDNPASSINEQWETVMKTPISLLRTSWTWRDQMARL